MNENKLINISGLPIELQSLMNEAVSGYIDFPNREISWDTIQNTLLKGDYRLATILLNDLCKQQDNLCAGIPPELQALIDTADSGHIDFPGREIRWDTIQNALLKGDYRLATILLNDLCKQQDNLRKYNQH